ncbi:hypothetical protein FRB95_007160 [Tulasnella sp. JGI-2019a]|nr:hypothetical protein FRB93_013603 [Tulasnella sp. JGI-2019a]KAG9039733.1 hypothetical protein FRB95_007160 [Tulasnella sp. JGI-2019a]
MPGSDYDRTIPLEQITFEGKGSEDVTVFLQSIKRVAMIQGRQRDDDWMVDYTEASLTGDALRWFSDLDEGTLRSWRTVRNAFLKRFTAPVTNSVGVPVPAAAVGASAAARPRVVPQKPSRHPLPSEVLRPSIKDAALLKRLW